MQYPTFFRKVALIAALASASLSAQAYTFECVTGAAGGGANASGCTTLGESWLQWSLAGNLLTISNIAPAGNGSFISGISFDTQAGQSVSLAGVQMPGVSYTTGGGANLPGNLGWTVDYKFKPNAPAASKGVNAGESLAFNLNGFGLSDITAGNVKFGLHIQGLPDGRSEKLVATVPEVETYALAGAGLAVVGLLSLRRRQIR